MCDCKEYETLKERNKYLEEVCYNTQRNSGRSISDEVKEINQKDELISLRNEFKLLIQANTDLRKQIQPKTPCCYYFCDIL